MKKLLCFKAFVLLLNFPILATHPTDKEEENVIVPTLTAMCLQSIDKGISTYPSFILDEAEKLKSNLKEESERSNSPLRIASNSIDEVLKTYFLLPKDKDAPFFRLEKDGKQIYVLGSQHTVPIYKCLALESVHELKRISELNPILYTEHEHTNRSALPLLKEAQHLIDPLFLKFDMDLLRHLALPQIEGDEFKACIGEIPFLLNVTESSNVKLQEVLEAKSWLAALLLGAHANLLSYQKFGGLDAEVVYDKFWNIHWRSQKFLEDSTEVVTIQQHYERSNSDDNQNIIWARKSINSIIAFIKSDKKTLEEINRAKWAQMLTRYSWDVIEFSNRQMIPESVIERNTLWANRLFEVIGDEVEHQPLLIIIGEGHLVGYRPGWSFLSLLNAKLGWLLSRFSNEHGWVQVN